MIRCNLKFLGHLRSRPEARWNDVRPLPGVGCDMVENHVRKSLSTKGIGASGDQVCDAERR